MCVCALHGVHIQVCELHWSLFSMEENIDIAEQNV